MGEKLETGEVEDTEEELLLPDEGGGKGLVKVAPSGRQHWKLFGPGHKPVNVAPLPHVSLYLHIPTCPGPHFVVQHFTSEGSLGQNPEREVPSVTAQVEVVTQMPGMPPASQGSWMAACAARGRMRERRGMRCMVIFCC